MTVKTTGADIGGRGWTGVSKIGAGCNLRQIADAVLREVQGLSTCMSSHFLKVVAE